ncbi:MAG: tRNA (N6-threonylcarbamoyladenosine(37)-N6)-methyltransferase TrmO [Bdellovibrionaceae bacterium]|nr:tRNA (N6-threonylcarbamoyladenosine(37)-N6)-methyltransferase TrmO [Pseudobdellovibrionaceae bacterium]
MDNLNFQPIGYFHSSLEHPNEAPRQPNPLLIDTAGVIQLHEGFQFHEALRDLDGFSHIWIVFHFHKNTQWHPMVLPPRGSHIKRGVFSTRSPYRPNPIGMSVLELRSIEGLRLTVGPSDLLNATPILDIKPYIPHVDAHPEARRGWLENSMNEKYTFSWSELALRQLKFLEEQGLTQLRGFVVNQMEYEPLDSKKKRLYFLDDQTLLAYRTWRVRIQVDETAKTVQGILISSGYPPEDLLNSVDTYTDKALHRAFIAKSF